MIDLATAMKAAAARDMAAYRRAYGQPAPAKDFRKSPIPPMAIAILRDVAKHDPEPVTVDGTMAARLGCVTQSLTNAIRVLEPKGLLDVQRVRATTKAPRIVRLTDAGRAFLATGGA